jgi:indolepyruvate ferredoxin oxidoreductase
MDQQASGTARSARRRAIDESVTLADRYDLEKSRVHVTGAQAVVRMALMQRARDAAAGHDTAGYVSGYRGSPVGGLDMQLERAAAELAAANIVFQPGLNEDIAATALSGTQQANLHGEGLYDGVFGLWYGKGPGADRSGDAFRHANFMGTAPLGGVIALAGDDHTAESSTTAHQSEFAFVDAMFPVLNPSGLQELVDFGLTGIAMSRFSGAWVGLKTTKDTMEVTGTIDGDPHRLRFVIPHDFAMPEGGLGPRPGDTVLAGEARIHDFKLAAARAFARANGLDRVVWQGGRRPRIGIATIGKSYLDVRQAFELLGIDETRAADLGVRLFKVAMAWPLEPEAVRRFAAGLDLIIVVEEKRGLIEPQMRAILYGGAGAPAIIGKEDEAGQTLFPARGALDAGLIATAVGARIARITGDEETAARASKLAAARGAGAEIAGAPARLAYFCAGCPHNTSTRVPDGARAIAGIGCHYMAKWMDRATVGVTQMGGEGANWIGEARFSRRPHIFANIGDGTYNHSGILAIRAAVYAGVTMTYKLLFNDAVALTGGQANDGGLTVAAICQQLAGEGVARIVIVADEPRKYASGTRFPPGTRIEHRRGLERVQRELARIEGVTVLIYDQTCAAEKRRRRKRGRYPDPARRVIINELVCEGCGDCGVQSNCVAIEPVETEFGRKRRVNQSVCNKDFSCLDGFCPSFVTIEGGELRRRERQGVGDEAGAAITLTDPDLVSAGRVWSMVVAGIGGTGIVTIGALVAMAAHLEGRASGVLDMTGLAQKNGAVSSHVRVADDPAGITAIRIAEGGADLVLGCDMVTTAHRSILALMDRERTDALVNSHLTMTADFARKPDLTLDCALMEAEIGSRAREGGATLFDASGCATALMGDAIASNLFMLGLASQKGLLPVSPEAIRRAIELNDVAVEMNLAAFRWGRRAALDPEGVAKIAREAAPADTREAEKPATTLEDIVARRAAFLGDYQDPAHAGRYRAMVERAARAEARAVPGSTAFAAAVARGYFKLLATKDEYEVARLLSDPAFAAEIAARFTGAYRIVHHLAPPLIARRDRETGRPRKRAFGPWIRRVLALVAKAKGLRGTPFDPFGLTAERRLERRLTRDYEARIAALLPRLSADTIQTATEIAALPLAIRGFGPVKAAAVERARAREAELLAALEQARTAAAKVA